MSWRDVADWAKRRPATLRVADQLGRGRGRLRWLDSLDPPPPAPIRPDLTGWADRELSAVWIGHATLLLRVGGLSILTDPVMSHRIGVGMGLMTAGPRRHAAAALDVRDLPPIDLILSSHAHFDHLDRPTLARLPKSIPVIAAQCTRDLFDDLHFRRVHELRWGESQQLNGVRITAQRVTHWGARTFFDRHRSFNGYLLETSRRRILFGGDTAFQEHFSPIGKVDLAILGISAYDPYIHAHATPEQAWEMANHVRADFVLPMHHSTFRLSYEPMHEPIQRMLAAAGNDEKRIVVRDIGGSFTL